MDFIVGIIREIRVKDKYIELYNFIRVNTDIHISSCISQYMDPLSSGSKKWITTSPLAVFTISLCLINKVAASPYINVGIPDTGGTTSV